MDLSTQPIHITSIKINKVSDRRSWVWHGVIHLLVFQPMISRAIGLIFLLMYSEASSYLFYFMDPNSTQYLIIYTLNGCLGKDMYGYLHMKFSYTMKIKNKNYLSLQWAPMLAPPLRIYNDYSFLSYPSLLTFPCNRRGKMNSSLPPLLEKKKKKPVNEKSLKPFFKYLRKLSSFIIK